MELYRWFVQRHLLLLCRPAQCNRVKGRNTENKTAVMSVNLLPANGIACQNTSRACTLASRKQEPGLTVCRSQDINTACIPKLSHRFYHNRRIIISPSSICDVPKLSCLLSAIVFFLCVCLLIILEVFTVWAS